MKKLLFLLLLPLCALLYAAMTKKHSMKCCKPAKKSSPDSKKSYRQKKSIAKQRRQSGSLGRLK